MTRGQAPACPPQPARSRPPSRRSRVRTAGRLLVLAACLVACGRSLPNATPEGAVRELVEQLGRFDGDPRDAEALFDLLSERAKKNLRARAERYGAASGRKIAPSAMLVPSRMAPRFTPQLYRAQITGSYALVEVSGVAPSERAEIPCVLEQGVWRVDLVLPELPPMRQRPGGEP